MRYSAIVSFFAMGCCAYRPVPYGAQHRGPVPDERPQVDDADDLRRRGRGPAAEARSKARLLAFNESKRQRALAESKLRYKLNLALKRMRFERMWMVKHASVEGREVAPSLSEVMASLQGEMTSLPPTSVAKPPPHEMIGTKRAAACTPMSPPGPSLSVEGVKPSPLKKPRSGKKKCPICGYKPYTSRFNCTCKYHRIQLE